MPHHSKEEVSAREYHDQKNGEQVERNLGAPRMQNEQRVGTVAPHCQRKGHGERRQDKQPKQAFHCPACFRIGLYARTAARLSPSVGSETPMLPEPSCFSVTAIATAARERVSKYRSSQLAATFTSPW